MRSFFITLLAATALLGVVPDNKADVMDKKTILTFSEPVQIPGVVLNPGKYVFKRVDNRNPDVLKVTNANETHLYAMLMALPIQRAFPTDYPVVTFEERRSGAPEAIHALYYPGEVVGERFLYPKGKAETVMSASMEKTEPRSSPPAEPSNTPEESSSAPAEPSNSEIAQATPPDNTPSTTTQRETTIAQNTPQASTPDSRTAPTDQDTSTTKSLPKTASPLALLALMGAGVFAGGISLKALAKSKS